MSQSDFDSAFSDLTPKPVEKLDDMFADLPSREAAGQARLAAARAANPGGPEIGATEGPTLGDSLGRAFNTLIGTYDDRPLIGRIQDATGQVVDAVTPDALQRGVLRGKQGITLGLDLSGVGPRSVYDTQPVGMPSLRTQVQLADLNRQAERYAAPPERQQALQRIGSANSVGELFGAVAENPTESAKAVGDVVLESLGVGFPGLALTAAGSLLGPGGTAAGAGLSSLGTEYTQTILQKIQERGGNPSDPNSWGVAFNDPEFMADAKQSALERGIPIAAFDALTAGLAGRFIKSAQGVRQTAIASGKEAGMQMAGGATGELVAQVADQGKMTSLGEVALEAVAEGPNAVVETAGNILNSSNDAQTFTNDQLRARLDPKNKYTKEQALEAAMILMQRGQRVDIAPDPKPDPQPTVAPAAAAQTATAPTDVPAPVQPTAPPAAPVAAAGATIQPAEPPQVPSTQASQPPEPPVQPAAQPAPVQQPSGDVPGAPVENGFFRGPAAGTRFRVFSTNTHGGVVLEKRNDNAGTMSGFVVGVDGNFIDQDNINLADKDSLAKVWKPADDAQRKAAEDILQQMGSLDLGDPKRKELAAKLKSLVTGNVNQTQTAPAPAQPQSAPTPQPPQPVAAPAAPQGNRRTVTTATGRKVDTEFQVVDLSTLQAATGDLQNRDRTRATSDLQIQNIAGNLDPERLGDSAEADRGAPIVGPDNVVESGNGRVAAIRKAYESVPERAEAYRQFLQSQGYNIDGMAQPVLVRRRVTEMTPEERRAFVIEANTSATARLNAVEQAKSDADLVGDDVLQLYRGGEFGAAGNRDFVRSLVGKLPQSEQAALYGPDGALSQEGIRRIQNALLARAYDDTALLSKFTEDQDNNIRSIGSAMLDVAGAWAQLRADVRAGRVKPEFDITQALVDAARRITVARDRGETVQQVLSQVDAFNPMNPLTERLIRTFYNKDLGRAAGRDKIAEALRAYAVEAQKQTTDASLFGSDLPDVTPEQILDAQLGKRVEAAPAQQTSMFGAGGRPTVQAAAEPQKPAPSKKDQVKVWDTETGTYVDGDTSGKIEYIHGENADGEFAGIVRLYDQSGKLVREVKLGVQSYFDSIGFHEAVFGPDSDAEITIDGKQQAAEDREPMQDRAAPAANTIDVDGVQRPRTNSDGKPIERDDEKLRNFWRWFGDSKVVDEKGRPVVVYHGSPNTKIKIFDAGYRGLIYATADKDYASDYAGEGRVYSLYMKAEKIARYDDPAVMDVLLRENPGFTKEDIIEAFEYGYDAYEYFEKDSVGEALQALGYDSFAFDEEGQESIGVYSNKNIKTAGRNSGAYGRDTGNIMEDRLNDRRPAARADEQADPQGAAQDEADLMAELDEEPQQSQRGRNATPEIMRVSFTDRRSWAEQAFADAGVDPDEATLWPIERQFETLANLVKTRFGITVKKTGTLQGRYAVDQMLDLYRNLQFMAFTMGLPANAFGLRGKLNLVLRKGMQYFGAYYPSASKVEGVNFPAGTIVLPKRSNSFAHEWMHALDHYLMQLFPEPNSFPLLSQQVRNKGVDYPAASAKEAFVRLMDHLFYDLASLAARILALELHLENPNISATAKAKAEAQLQSLKRGNARAKSVAPSDFRRTSANFDPGNADYWANPQEMLARAFEAYTAFKVERAGGTTEAIAKGDMAYLSNADKRLAETFPKGDERFRIFAAFDELFMMMAKEQLIADGQAAAVPGNTSQFDPNVWHRTPATRPEYKGLAGAIRQTLDEMRQAASRIRREDARPDNPKPLGQQIQDVSKVAVSVEMEAFRIFERRYPNSKAIKMLANLLVPMPGADRYVDRVLEDAAEMRYKANINRLSNIIERYQLEDLNETGIRVLRDLLISEDVRNAPENIRKSAPEIRRLLDMEWYANQQAGLDIGHTKNGFLPRLLDMAMVTSDREGFVTQASKVYEIIFDKEFGADVAEVMDRGDNFSGVVKFLRQARKSGIDVKPMMKVLRRIRKMEAQMKTSEDPDILQGKIEQTTEELHELLSDIYDQVRSDKARFDAEAWHTAIMTADTNDFDAMSPTARYTKSRTLPPEADKLMEDYYINDPIEAIQTYFSQSARRTEYAKRFGPKGEKVKPLFEQMTAEGVAADDQAYMVDMLSRLTGRARTNLPPTYAKFLSGVQALGIVTLLPRAVWSAVFEPVMAAVRTGNLKDTVRPHINMIKGVVGTADAKDWAEIARVIGLVTNSMADTLAANRFGGNFGDSVKTQRMTAQFSKRSLLHGITNASRIAVLPLQHEYLHGLARRINEGRDVANSVAQMREVGIKDPAAFSKWILESDRMPTMEELFDSNGIETKFGYEWITAMTRISEQTIQASKTYSRPMMANNPHGRLIYGILSFSMTFYENVWKRNARLLSGMSGRTGKASAAKYAAFQLLPAFGALYIAQTLMSTLREAIFNQERWEEWEKEGVLVERLLQLGFTRTFAFGLADVPIQAFTGLKYQRDLSNMFIGPVPGYFLQATQGLLTPLINNSEKTNNAEYKAAQSAYQLVAAPMIARTLSLAPGGKLIDPLYGVGMQYFTSPSSRDAVADVLVGEKDSRVKARERAEKKEATGRATGRETGRETGRKTGRETGRDTGG